MCLNLLKKKLHVIKELVVSYLTLRVLKPRISFT